MIRQQQLHKRHKTMQELTEQLVRVPPIRRVLEMVAEGSEDGFCLACGRLNGCCGADTRNLKCVICDEPEVFGVVALAEMNL